MNIKMTIGKNLIIANTVIFVFGIILFFLIISIMADGCLNWKTTFWILIPILLIYGWILLFILISTIKVWCYSKIRFGILSILSIIIMIIFLMNVATWIDLFYGKTDVVNGNYECSIFGNIECSVFGNNSAAFSVTMMHHFS